MDQQVDGSNRAYGPDVMVSYSSHDRAQVMQFTQRLRAAGVAAWIDQGGIDGAQKWGEEIVNAIDSCKTVILMISQTSMQSENINKEVMLAWENGKHFLPLCLEDAKIPKSMQYQLAGIQQIKLYEGDPEAKFVSVLRALVRLGVHVSPYYIALVSAELGDREQAFEWLNRAVEQRSSGLSRLKTEARFNQLRSDPRFVELMKRAESVPLEPESAPADVPAFLPRPVSAHPAPLSGPVPLWRKILWPDIVNDRSARQAAAQGVWACALLVVVVVLGAMLDSAPGGGSALGTGWSSVLVILVIFVPIALGTQKMGRAAAIIGLVLCAFGALGNLQTLQTSEKIVDSYSQMAAQAAQNPYYQQPQYQNPYLTQAYSQYYHSWFGLVVGLLCVGAFTNATRGTLAYRRLVVTHQAQDKQDAISRDDWNTIKSRVSSVLGKSRSASAPVRVAAPPAMPARTQPASPMYTATPAPSKATVVGPPTPVEIAEPAQTSAAPEAAPVEAAPMRQGFAAMIGVSGGVIYWPRVAAFFLANVAGGLMFLLGRSLTDSVSVPAVYWLFAIGAGCVFTAAAVVGFRFFSNVWAAMAVASAAAAVVALPCYSLLPSFAWADLVYREQFQQFILLPFVSSFILLAALVWVVPRLQPLVLALWLGAMGTEIATSLVANLLHGLGAAPLPDAVLGGTSVISAVLRSLAFALVLWGGLQYVRKQSGVAGG